MAPFHDPNRFWVIDRDKGVWLRKFYDVADHTEPDGGITGETVWDGYWKGHLMTVEVMMLEAGGKTGGHRWSRK